MWQSCSYQVLCNQKKASKKLGLRSTSKSHGVLRALISPHLPQFLLCLVSYSIVNILVDQSTWRCQSPQNPITSQKSHSWTFVVLWTKPSTKEPLKNTISKDNWQVFSKLYLIHINCLTYSKFMIHKTPRQLKVGNALKRVESLKRLTVSQDRICAAI